VDWASFSSDVLVINKVDLAPYVRVDVERMVREGGHVRSGRPILLTNCHTGDGVDAVVERIAADSAVRHTSRTLSGDRLLALDLAALASGSRGSRAGRMSN
jgi:hypothetical protein